MSEELRKLVEHARGRTMTPAEREAQIRSFAYGNLALEHPGVTRALIDRIADEQNIGRR